MHQVDTSALLRRSITGGEGAKPDYQSCPHAEARKRVAQPSDRVSGRLLGATDIDPCLDPKLAPPAARRISWARRSASCLRSSPTPHL